MEGAGRLGNRVGKVLKVGKVDKFGRPAGTPSSR
jgi:hypothetical protein